MAGLRTLLLVFALVGAGPAAAQVTAASPLVDGAQAVSLDSLARKLDPAQFQAFKALTAKELVEHPPVFTNGASAGILIGMDPKGGLRLNQVPTVKPGEVLILSDSIPWLSQNTPVDLAALFADLNRTATLLKNIQDSTKSVNPIVTNWTVDKLPLEWREPARLENWNGATGTYDPACPASRTEFSQKAEKKLLGEGSDPLAFQPEPDRTEIVDAIKAFDTTCLSPLSPQTVPKGVQLDALAVIAGPLGVHCMATFIGKGLFVTARHCFYQSHGALWPDAQKFTVSMIDKSALDVPVRVAPSQPFATPGTGRRDILVLTSDGLPSAFSTRAGAAMATSDKLPTLKVAQAFVAGYFSLANPAAVLPPNGSRGRLPEWSQALRYTRTVGVGYCRVWDYTPPAVDGAACLQHGCQTIKGFSGAPVFARKRDVGENVWVMIGVHVASGENADAEVCGTFVGQSSGGLLSTRGGIAAALPNALVQLASTPQPIVLAAR